MKVIYVGDFIKKNGPSVVDINLTDNDKENIIIKVQINKVFKMEEIKKIFTCEILNVSGVSLKGVVYALLSRICRKKIVFLMHGTLKKEKEFRTVPKERLILEKIMTSIADNIVCVSNELKSLVDSYYCTEKKSCYINNGINIINEEKNFTKDNNLILSIGGGRPEKGIKYLCEAIQRVNSLGKNYKLVVAGEDGDDTDIIKKYDFVEYKGFITKEELNELYKMSGIFIQNSIYEPFGMAILEAYQFKCNVIVSEECGIPIKEIIRIKHNDVEGYIDELMKASDERPNKKLNLDVFSWQNIRQEYQVLWGNIIK